MMLYKYHTINDDLKASLAEQYVWFSAPSSFNDINDSALRLDSRYTEEEILRELDFVRAQIYRIASMQQDYSTNPLLLEAQAQHFFSSILMDRGPEGQPDHNGRLHASVEKSLEDRRHRIGISCYSQGNSNELLWAHYAAAHYGLCLGIETAFDRECFQQLEQVKYVEVLPKLKLLSHMGENLKKLYTIKSSAWSYEQEVRAFQHGFGKYRMNPRCLVNVAFGIRTREADLNEICGVVRKRYGRQVALLQMTRGAGGKLALRALAD